jgi:Fe-S-cluster-containing dehydrogenase component
LRGFKKMASYGMVVNLNKCVRCRTGYVVCKKEHHILAHPRDPEHPYEYYRLRYLEWEQGKYPKVKRSFIPVHCMHCQDPLCLTFCSVEAITQRSGGIVVIDKERCNGCGVCAQICPYGALYINRDEKADGCDFCADRLDAGMAPKCVEMCPAGARIFGELDDSQSEVSKLIETGEAKPLHLRSVVHTRVYYIPSTSEPDWGGIATNRGFIEALGRRKKDLPPLKGVL